MTLRMIQPMGNKPNAAPYAALAAAASSRHPVNPDSHCQRHRQRCHGRKVDPDSQQRDGTEQHHDRQRGDDRGKKRVGQRIVVL